MKSLEINRATFLPIKALVSIVEMKLSMPDVYHMPRGSISSPSSRMRSNETRGSSYGYECQTFSWLQDMSCLPRRSIPSKSPHMSFVDTFRPRRLDIHFLVSFSGEKTLYRYWVVPSSISIFRIRLTLQKPAGPTPFFPFLAPRSTPSGRVVRTMSGTSSADVEEPRLKNDGLNRCGDVNKVTCKVTYGISSGGLARGGENDISEN